MRQYTIFPLVALALGTLASCGGKPASTKAPVTPTAGDTLPVEVVSLCQAIVTGDSTAFASLVQYPLERPYPLHDINDASSMRHYYSTMVDDSLRHAVASDTMHWHKYGWRGWAPSDGEYLWIDSLVYAVNYLSPREKSMIDSLTRAELASLPHDMQGHWHPERCYAGGSLVYRIDRDTVTSARAHYRLSIFHVPLRHGQRPELIASGFKNREGSAGNETYVFSSGTTEYIIVPYPDGDNMTPVIIDSNHRDSVIPITPTYWLEQIK